MSRETSISEDRKPTPPEEVARLSAALDSADPGVLTRAIVSLYAARVDEFPAASVLERFASHPDPRVRMAAVDYVFVEAMRGAAEPADAEIGVLARLMPRFSGDLYVTRCMVNRVVQHRLSASAPLLLTMVPGFPRPEWLLTAYGALHPFSGYGPLRDLLRAHPGQAWEEEAHKHLYRLDPASAILDFRGYLPSIPDKKLWRVLEALGHEMTQDYVPILEGFVRERDARVRRVCVAILRWLAGEERARASYAQAAIPDEERRELDAVARGR